MSGENSHESDSDSVNFPGDVCDLKNLDLLCKYNPQFSHFGFFRLLYKKIHDIDLKRRNTLNYLNLCNVMQWFIAEF